MSNQLHKEAGSLYPRLTQALGGGDGAEIASNTIVLTAGAALVSALARAINQTRSSVTEYGGVPMDVHLNTTMKDPVISDSSLINKPHTKRAFVETLKNLGSIGVSTVKGVRALIGGAASATEKLADLLKSLEKEETWEASNLGKWAIPAAGAVAGVVGGSKLIDNMYDKSDAAALDKSKDQLTRLHKDLIIARALQQRGALSESDFQGLMAKSGPIAEKADMKKTAEDKVNKDDQGGSSIPLALFGLITATAAALAGKAAYDYASERNPRRLQYKAIKDGLKQYAQGNALMRTIDQRLTDDPAMLAKLQTIKSTKGASPVETPIEYTPVTI